MLSDIYALNEVDHAEFNNVLDLFEEQKEQFLKFNKGQIVLEHDSSGSFLDHLIHERCKLPISKAVDISDALATFSIKKHYRKFVRGKYILWFVIEFCKSIHNCSSQLFSALDEKPKALYNLAGAQGVVILSSWSAPPAALTNFMHLNYVTYIKWHKSRYQ